jgi:hypothetical protein
MWYKYVFQTLGSRDTKPVKITETHRTATEGVNNKAYDIIGTVQALEYGQILAKKRGWNLISVSEVD